MPRINLSVDQELYDALSADAAKNNSTVNVYLISILEKIYKENPTDYGKALEKIIEEVKGLPENKDFILFELDSFNKVCSEEAAANNTTEAAMKSRFGKMFNTLLIEGKIPDVERSCKDDGTLKFISRAAVYHKKYREMIDEKQNKD